jgi:hypothetical protein
VVFDFFYAGLDGAEEEGAGYAEMSERLAYDAWLEGGEVGGDVGEFRHVVSVWKNDKGLSKN